MKIEFFVCGDDIFSMYSLERQLVVFQRMHIEKILLEAAEKLYSYIPATLPFILNYNRI
jgi:hypothetical protein